MTVVNNFTSKKFKVFNPEDEECMVSQMFNNLYLKNTFQNIQQIPKEIGSGYSKRFMINATTEIFISDSTFYKDITIQEEIYDASHYGLAFCLEDPFQWRMEGSKKEYVIGCGESYIFHGESGNNTCTYLSGQRFLGVSLQYNQDIISNLVRDMRKSTLSWDGKESQIFAGKFSNRIKLILNDIIRCQYSGDIKKIYLEGKSMELLAIYLDDIQYGKEKQGPLLKYSPSDVESLYHARRILDDNLANPPTINELSKLVFLNENKLKSGFREMFQIPIHAYIIDQRMDLARHLIEKKGMSVCETAFMVGYSNTNYFTEKFKIKFGMKPSECKRI